MANISSRAQPRSAPDPDAVAYDEMIRKHLALAAGPHPGADMPRSSTPTEDDGHDLRPSEGADPLDKLNFARKARERWEHGDRVDAMTDAIQGAMDAIVLLDSGRGLLKGGLKLTGPFDWRTKPWQEAGFRKWLGEKGFLKPGQHGHHALIPNNGWGKGVPDWIKNQPPNIKGTATPAQHGRIHGNYKGMPQYNLAQRYWLGTPRWWKATNAWMGAAAADGLAHLSPLSPPPNTIGPAQFPKVSL